eukprot:g4161.t1
MGPPVSTGSQNEVLDPRCAGCVCQGEVVATGCPVCRHHYLLRRCPVTVESISTLYPYVAQSKGTPRACRRSKRWVSFSIHVGGPRRRSLYCQSDRTGQTRCVLDHFLLAVRPASVVGTVGAGGRVEKVVVLPSASVELVELELFELAPLPPRQILQIELYS